ncbi:MAG: hypothetical protein WCF90_05415 [Methanomicrobiales archaeon]
MENSRAELAGIPVLAGEISLGSIPIPAIDYGINYFATTASDNEAVQETVKHITNKGKYPFCY